MAKLITRADFARLTGKSRATITKHCKDRLKPAIRGDRLEMEEPCMSRYIVECGSAPSVPSGRAKTGRKKAGKKKASKGKSAAKAVDSEAFDPKQPLPYLPSVGAIGDITELAGWTLKQIVDQLGTLRMYKDHLEAYEKQERALKYHLENLETMGELIERERVQTHVFAIINAGFERLLRDVPRNVTARLYGAAKSGTPIEKSEKIVRDAISSILRPIKDSSVRRLKQKTKR